MSPICIIKSSRYCTWTENSAPTTASVTTMASTNYTYLHARAPAVFISRYEPSSNHAQQVNTACNTHCALPPATQVNWVRLQLINSCCCHGQSWPEIGHCESNIQNSNKRQRDTAGRRKNLRFDLKYRTTEMNRQVKEWAAVILFVLCILLCVFFYLLFSAFYTCAKDVMSFVDICRRLSVLLSVCLSVSNFTQKLLNGSSRKFYHRCVRGQEELVKFWKSSVSGSGSKLYAIFKDVM